MLVSTPAREDEVGISEYLSPEVHGFCGVFKSLWQDFHVYEVDPQGVELHLSELITPGAIAAELKKAAEERREARSSLGPGFRFEPAVEGELEEVLGKEILQELLSFLQKQPQQPSEVGEEAHDQGGEVQAAEPPPGYVDLSADDINDGSKEARKKAHQVVLKHLGTFLNTETVESDGVRSIRVWMREAERKAKAPTAATSGDASRGGKGTKKGKGKGGKGKGKNCKGKSSKSEGPSLESSAGPSFGTMRREGWPKDRPDYLYFRLYKENCDTGEAVSSIARCVGRSAKQFTFAGTKDRRAVTVQQLCAHRLPIDQLRRSVLHRLWDKRVRISNLEYRRERLRLGQLRGNRFKVVLRKVPLHNLEAVSHDSSMGGSIGEDRSKSIVSRAFVNAQRGFLNYFGLQRFGTRQVRTHRVGAAIIAGEWQKAVRLILGADECCNAEASTAQKRPSEEALNPSKRQRCIESEDTEMRAAFEQETKELATQGQQYEAKGKSTGKGGKGQQGAVLEAQRLFLDGDPQRALEVMPRSQHLERCLLGALARDLSYVDALSQLPHQAVSLYAHAAQSLLWNAVLSRRIREFGRQPRAGDLVMADHSGKALHDLPGTVDANEEHLFDEAGEQDDSSEDDHETQSLPSVRALSGEDVSSAKLTDIMLPLPGSDVVYPEYLQQVYEEMSVSLLGLPLADFASCKLVPLKGSYRNAVVCPESLEWHSIAPELLSTSALVESDVAQLLRDRPLNAELKEGGSAASASNSGSGAPTDPELSKCKDLQEAGTGAVMFSCVLPPSSYLTMLLREVMKQITPPPGG